MGKYILFGTFFIHFQCIIEDQLKMGIGCRGGGALSVRHKGRSDEVVRVEDDDKACDSWANGCCLGVHTFTH